VKGKFITAIVVVIAVGGVGLWVYTQPHRAVSSLQDAVDEQDAEELREIVDFASVRQSLKDQMNAKLVVEPKKQGLLGMLGNMFIGAVGERAIDAVATPEGFVRMLRDDPDAPAVADATADAKEAKGDLFVDAQMGYEASDKFVVAVPHEDGDGVTRVVFRRRGWSTWRVTDIRLAGFAAPNACEAVQASVKKQLKSLFAAVETASATSGTYPNALPSTWTPSTEAAQHYTFSVQAQSGGQHVLLTARGKGKANGDVWTLNDDLQMKHVANGCR